MKKILITLLLIIIMLMTACVQKSQQTQSTPLSLENIGLEGNLQKHDTAYVITYLSEIGVYSLAIKKDKLQDQLNGGIYTVSVSGREYLLETNPFDQNIIETIIEDTVPLDEIKTGRINTIDSARRKKLLAREEKSRDTLSMAHVIVEKEPGENGTALYQIATQTYISMRNANVFVFDEDNAFMPPVYVISNEDNTYSISTFISARNAAADSSIHGAFAFLKAHPDHQDLLETVYPNRVRVEDGDIIIDPPEDAVRRLRDLGSEGNLQEEDNVYNIIDNTSIGYWAVSFIASRLPDPEVNASDWKLVIGEQEFNFVENDFTPGMFEVSVPETMVDSIEDVRNALFEISDETQANKIKFLYADGNPSYFRYYIYDKNGQRIDKVSNVTEIDTSALEHGTYRLLVVGGSEDGDWRPKNFYFYEEIEIDGTGKTFNVENFQHEITVAAKEPSGSLVLESDSNKVYIGYLDNSLMRIHGIFVYHQPIYIQGNLDYLGVNCPDAGLFLSDNPDLKSSDEAQNIVFDSENTGEITYINNTPFENARSGGYPAYNNCYQLNYYSSTIALGNSLIVSPFEYFLNGFVFDDNYGFSIQTENSVEISENDDHAFNFGGNLIVQKPINDSYSPDETVRFYSSTLLKDSYDNDVRITKYTEDQSGSPQKVISQLSAQNPENAQMDQRRVDEDHITIAILDSNDQLIHEETLGSYDRFEYTLKEEGNYKLSVEIDTGDWQGNLQETYPFTVGEVTNDYHGDWDLTATVREEAENYLIGSTHFDFESSNELRSARINLYEVGDVSEVCNMNLTLYEETTGSYHFENGQLILENTYTSGYWSTKATVTQTENGAYMILAITTPHTTKLYDTELLKKETINPSDIEGDWPIEGQYEDGSNDRIYDYTGTMNIPDDLQIGDTVTLSLNMEQTKKTIAFSVQNISQTIPRIISLSRREDNGDRHYLYVKVKDDGYLIGSSF